MNTRRILFVLLFIASSIAFAIALFFVFFKQPTTDDTIPPRDGAPLGDGQAFPNAGLGQGGVIIDGGPDTLPPIGEIPRPSELSPPTIDQRTQQLIADDILNPQLVNGSQVQFYNQQDGKFYRRDEQGNILPLSDTVFFNVETVTWSGTGNEAILEYPDQANIYYNFDTKKQVTLPRHWENFSFSDQGNQIVAKSIGQSPENRWLIVSNPDGSNTRLVEPLGTNADKVTVDWSPNQQMLALSRTGDALGGNREEVLLIGQNGENFPSLIVEGRGMESRWAPNGNQLLYSVYNAENDFKPQLWIVSTDPTSIGAGRQVLNVDTWAHKCDFNPTNQRFVYCGVPEQLETGAGFQPAIANTIPDRLYRIDTQTGIQTEIMFDDDQTHTIESLFLSDDGSSLFFTDTQEDGLFEVAL